jgi:hypothetical protein
MGESEFSPLSRSETSPRSSGQKAVDPHATKRELSSVHHSRRGLSAPLGLRGVDGVSLDASASAVTIAPPDVSSKDVAGQDGVRTELTVALSGLPRLEKTDACCRAFAVLFVWTATSEGDDDELPHSEWVEYGRTETVQHGSRPDFTRSFYLDLLGKQNAGSGPAQRCRLNIYSRVSTNPRLAEQVLLGEHEFTLSDLYHVPGSTDRCKLPDNNGYATIKMTPVQNDDFSVSVAVSGSNFRVDEDFSKDKASLLDLFFILYRGGEGGDVTNVEATYRSEVCWQTDLPRWKAVEMSLHRLCAGDLDHEVVLEVYDWNNMGDHLLLGSTHMTARALVNSKVATSAGIPITPPEGGSKGLPPGRLVITGDMRSSVIPDTSEAAKMPDGVYYCDVGDAAGLEDNRFLSSLLADMDVQSSNMREVVDDGMRAVAEREFFMNAFLKNRATVQAEPKQSGSESFKKPFNPTALLPVDPQIAAEQEQEAAAETRQLALNRSRSRGTPDMLTRAPSLGKIRHSFSPSPTDFTSSQVLATMSSTSVGTGGRYVDSRRLSQKYKRMPRHLRGRVPEGRDRSGKLFGILFPRHRYSEMHDMHDEVGEMMRGLSVGRQRSYG